MADEVPAGPIRIGLLVAVSVILVFYIVKGLAYLRKYRERFASQKAHEIHNSARQVFQEGGGDARYSEYKRRVPGADPVQYNDVRSLYKAGNLTPDAVQTVL